MSSEVPIGPQHGPWQRKTTQLRYGWRVLADETDYVGLDGRRWDVYLLHESGARVPAGPNYRFGDDAVEREQRTIGVRNDLVSA